MKGYLTQSGYSGWINGRYILFATEAGSLLQLQVEIDSVVAEANALHLEQVAGHGSVL